VVLAAAGACLAAARAGRGDALFVVGEGGLGKTSVLEAAQREAEADGMGVGFARGEQIESSLAFGLARGALGELGGLDGEPVADSSAPYYRVLQGLRDRAGGPLLVAVDDLHWADPDSLRLLAFLARRLDGMGVALIATLRPWPREAAEVCAELAAGGRGVLARLVALSRPAAAALLAERAEGMVSEAAERGAWRLCAGNPLLVGELARAVAHGERVPQSEGERGLGPGAGSGLLLARFAGVGPAALDCARAGAVLGTTFRPELAVRIAGIAEGEIVTALDGLSRSGLLAAAEDGAMRFVHPLFAEALYNDLALPVRRRLHERAFRELAERGLEAQAAAHAVRAELVGDRQALEVLARVGRRSLAAGAVAGAEQLLRSAVTLGGERPPAEVLIALGEALTALGLVDDALAALDGALSAPAVDWRERHRALRARGHALLMGGSPAASMQAHEQAVALALAHDEPALAVESLLDECLTETMLRGPGAALAPAARALSLAAGGEAGLRARAESIWANAAYRTGDPSGVAALRFSPQPDRPSGEHAFEPGQLLYPSDVLNQVTELAIVAEHFDVAERASLAMQAAAERAGATATLFTSLVHSTYLLIRRGRLPDALGQIERCEELAELSPALRPYLELPRAEALVWLGRLEESEPSCEAAERALSGLWFARLMLAHVRGLRLLWQGDEHAVEQFLVAEQQTAAAGIREPCMIFWASHAIEAQLRFDRAGDARRVLEWLEACASALPCRWPRAAVHLGRAALATDNDDDAMAEEHYRAALALHAEIDLPLQRAEVLLAYGGFLRHHGRSRDARAPLGEARQLAETREAAWLAEAARRELQLAGGRRRRRSEDRDQLTDAERRVAELAAVGHTNAEIARHLQLSLSTIETHLRHIYSKLGISSRRDLQRLGPPFEPAER
jgi:DNA-binding CsgD family transcriptional regulator